MKRGSDLIEWRNIWLEGKLLGGILMILMDCDLWKKILNFSKIEKSIWANSMRFFRAFKIFLIRKPLLPSEHQFFINFVSFYSNVLPELF
jgi:hypothetical protein